MEKLFGQAVFSVGNNEYNWEDVVLAAKVRGDWAKVENELHKGLACLSRATAKHYSLPVQEVTLEANDFRYKRSLITAEETELWLNKWQLSVEDWMGYIRRSMLRRKWAGNLSEIVSEYPVTDDEMKTSIRSEALCSGYLAEFARYLAGRGAVYEKLEEASEGAISRERVERHLEVLLKKVDSSDLESLTRTPLERLVNLATLETAFEEMANRCLTADALRSCITANRIDWIKLGFDEIAFADEPAAREAALCVREDQMTLAEVAADAQQPLRHITLYIEEVAAESKSKFLACAAGELLGPIGRHGHFVLCWVTDKTMPDEADPQIRQKAEQNILDTLVKREINDRVRWHLALG